MQKWQMANGKATVADEALAFSITTLATAEADELCQAPFLALSCFPSYRVERAVMADSATARPLAASVSDHHDTSATRNPGRGDGSNASNNPTTTRGTGAGLTQPMQAATLRTAQCRHGLQPPYATDHDQDAAGAKWAYQRRRCGGRVAPPPRGGNVSHNPRLHPTTTARRRGFGDAPRMTTKTCLTPARDPSHGDTTYITVTLVNVLSRTSLLGYKYNQKLVSAYELAVKL
ncbi:hypothetical protein EDB83DRAFT_2322753 [Lactarius deliciosus]|nr:hypothetical protein EDB83DRAFT_2322753 [Lactarius deliciosus]